LGRPSPRAAKRFLLKQGMPDPEDSHFPGSGFRWRPWLTRCSHLPFQSHFAVGCFACLIDLRPIRAVTGCPRSGPAHQHASSRVLQTRSRVTVQSNWTNTISANAAQSRSPIPKSELRTDLPTTVDNPPRAGPWAGRSDPHRPTRMASGDRGERAGAGLHTKTNIPPRITLHTFPSQT